MNLPSVTQILGVYADFSQVKPDEKEYAKKTRKPTKSLRRRYRMHTNMLRLVIWEKYSLLRLIRE